MTLRGLVLQAQVSVTRSNVAHVRLEEKPVKPNRGKLSYYSLCASRDFWISVSSDLIEDIQVRMWSAGKY